MKKNTHTASFQVSYFLLSKHSRKFKKVKRLLNGNSISILRTLADLMDIEFSKSNEHRCTISQRQLSELSGCSARTLRNILPKFVKYKLIKILPFENGEIAKFCLGKWITTLATIAYPRQPLPGGVGNFVSYPRQPLPTSNNASNKSYNKKNSNFTNQELKSTVPWFDSKRSHAQIEYEESLHKSKLNGK